MKIKKIVASFLTLSFVSLFVAPQSLIAQAATTKTTKTTKAVTTVAKSTLPANTPIVISAVDTISGDTHSTETIVNFKVEKDVTDAKGNILVRAGAPVSAKVSFSKPKARIGRSGEITVSDFNVTAVDGTIVPLTGDIAEKAKSKMKLSITLGVLVFPLFLLMRGEEAIIPAGTQETVYTTSDMYIKLTK